MTRRSLPAAATGIVAAFAAVALVPGASGASVCGPAAARTIASDGVARVYVTGGSAFGCAAHSGRAFRLGSTVRCSFMGAVVSIHLAGRVAAYGSKRCGIDTSPVTVTVRRLTSGKVLVSRPATTRVGVEGFQSIDGLVVKADGAVAWIGSARSIGPPKFIRQVARADRRGFRVLDSTGIAISRSSLRLRGSTISWRSGGARRSASLR